ncbi:ATP-binding cassette domain-containing protein [Salinicoccus sp. HZC-1]|uniref:ATP-binding cassette domain-containing protein n=1 Tax=Salinicoccus sp. HZC-1 TaxID=3385497 RepID=UPI00398B4B06
MKINIPAKHLVLYALMCLGAISAFILFGHNLSLILEDIVIGGNAPESTRVIWMAVFFILFTIITLAFKVISQHVANGRIESLGKQILDKIDDRTVKYSESMLNAVFVHLEKYRPFEKVFIPTVIQTMVKLCAIIIAMFFIHKNAAFIMIFSAPFIPLYYILVGLKTADESKAQAAQFDELGTLFLNLIRGKNTVRHTQSESTVIKRLKAFNARYVKDTMNILKYAFQSTLMLEFITILGIGLIALEVGLQIIVFENITFYAAFFTLLLAPEFYNALKVLGIEFHNGKLAQGNLEIIGEWLEKETIQEDYRIQDLENNAIELKNITVGHGAGALLENAELKVPETGFTAITGPSGIGKTTLLRTILGLHPPADGHVHIKNDDFGYISDQVYFSDTTLYDYVSDGEYDEEAVIGILDQLGMMESLNNLEKGIHTEIVNHNIPLSGGEIVRLKMARVLIKQPRIILMDEPTEFLDAETEQLVMSHLEKLKEEAAIIAVVHRRKLLKIADQHYTLSDQHIVPQKGGRY